jgi:hypothetical protein
VSSLERIGQGEARDTTAYDDGFEVRLLLFRRGEFAVHFERR